jgi:hypothetical protein
MLTAWIVQGEQPGPAEMLGGLTLLIGVAVTAISRSRSRAQTPAREDVGTAPAAEPWMDDPDSAAEAVLIPGDGQPFRPSRPA